MASSNMTTFVIAHRLSTVRNADKIAVVNEGQVVESGTHEELVALGGLYHSLVEKQQVGSNNKKDALGESMRSSMHDSLHGSIRPESAEEDLGTRESLIRFENVFFSYPARPDIEVFRGLNLSIKRGETLALCGPSGQGKSTVIQLTERF